MQGHRRFKLYFFFQQEKCKDNNDFPILVPKSTLKCSIPMAMKGITFEVKAQVRNICSDNLIFIDFQGFNAKHLIYLRVYNYPDINMIASAFWSF